MADVLLHDREQAAVRAIIASEPGTASPQPDAAVLDHLSRLIPCDKIGIVLVDGAGSAVRERAGHVPGGADLSSAAPMLGIQQVAPAPARVGSTARRGVAVLTLGVRSGPYVVKLWLVRRAGCFTDRDLALLGLVTPALERLLRVRPVPASPQVLTVQERRVLFHVAEGLSNAEIADRLVVAPSTVRKHLENAYRKLGVTNRLAAVHALQGSQLPEAGSRVDALA